MSARPYRSPLGKNPIFAALLLAPLGWALCAPAYAETPCGLHLSASDLRSLKSSPSPEVRALELARSYQIGKEAQLQALLSSVEEKALQAEEKKLLQGLPEGAKNALQLLQKNGAARDSSGRLSLQGFQLGKLSDPKNTDLRKAFELLFPSSKGKWQKILDPKRREVILLEGQALLPPAQRTSEPGQRFSPGVSFSAYQAAVAGELKGLSEDLRHLLSESRKGGTFPDLLSEVSSFYLNDVWGKPPFQPSHHIAQSAAQDSVGVRIRRLKSKWGLGKDALDSSLQLYSSVTAQAHTNRELAIDDLGMKATAVALAPLLYPVAAYGLLPAFGGGMLITGAEIVAGSVIEKQARGGDLGCHLARQLDEKLPHGFVMSLLFAPTGMLHKAATSTSVALRTGAKATSAGLVAVAGTGAVQSTILAVKLNAEAKSTASQDSELTSAILAERNQSVLDAVAGGAFAAMGLKPAITQKPQAPQAAKNRSSPVSADAVLSKHDPQQVALTQAKNLNRAQRSLKEQIGRGYQGQPVDPKRRLFRALFSGVEGPAKERPTREEFVKRVLHTSRRALNLHGVLLEPSQGTNSPIVIAPDKNGKRLNQIAWAIKKATGTQLIFDPGSLTERGSTAFFDRGEKVISLSFREVIQGTRSRSTSLKHEVLHLIRHHTPDLPFRGYVNFENPKASAYGEHMSFDEVITHSWSLVDTAKASRKDGMSRALANSLRDRLEMLEKNVLKDAEKVLTAALENIESLKVHHQQIIGEPFIDGHLPGIGQVRFEMNRASLKRLDPKNFPKELDPIDRAQFLVDEQKFAINSLQIRLETEVAFIRQLQKKIQAFREPEADVLKLATELSQSLQAFDRRGLAQARSQMTQVDEANETARRALDKLMRLYQDLQDGKVSLESVKESEDLLDHSFRLKQEALRIYGKEVNCIDCRRQNPGHVKQLEKAIEGLVHEIATPVYHRHGKQHLSRARELKEAWSKATGEERSKLYEDLLTEVSEARSHLETAGAEEDMGLLKREFKEEIRELEGFSQFLDDLDWNDLDF
jgi:hypothetical protein